MAIVINGSTGITATESSSVLGDNAVETADIAANAVTAAKLSDTLDLTGKTVTLPSDTGGKVLQVVHQEYTPFTALTSTAMTATGITATITPKSSSSFILVCVKVNGCDSNQTTAWGKYELYKNGSSISYLNDVVAFINTSPLVCDASFSVDYKDIHGTTSALTYAVYFACSSAGPRIGFNNYAGGNNRTKSSITLMEIAA